MMENLKPCPFCGGNAELLTLSGVEQGLSPVYWYVVCTNGCARTFRHISDHDAVEAWNRRADAPTVDAVSVVRCKDCKWSYDAIGGTFCSHGVCVDCVVYDDWFCADVVRKDG